MQSLGAIHFNFVWVFFFPSLLGALFELSVPREFQVEGFWR
jgi:hypothetical protein